MLRFFAALLVVSSLALSLRAQPSGHWAGVIHAAQRDVDIEVDLVQTADGKLTGTFGNVTQHVRGLPLSDVRADGTAIAFAIKATGGGVFKATLDGTSMKGTFAMESMEMPFELKRTGDAVVDAAPRSAPIRKELEGKWSGTLDVNGTKREVGLRLVNHAEGFATGTLISSEGMEIPIAIAEKDANVTLDVKNVGGTWTGTLNGAELRGTWTQGTFTAPLVFHHASDPIARWATAVGGRERVAAIRALYREATIQVAGMQGTIKAWHTNDGRYRKEEQVATFSTIETFDGTNGTTQQGSAPPRAMAGAELARARSSAYANASAMFFAFFPERRKGALTIEGDDTIVMRPEGGIDWRVTLDSASSLPKVMTHAEGNRTITVTFVKYETIDGVQFEQEIHRTTGDPRFDAVIRFTKTVINPEVDAGLFSR